MCPRVLVTSPFYVFYTQRCRVIFTKKCFIHSTKEGYDTLTHTYGRTLPFRHSSLYRRHRRLKPPTDLQTIRQNIVLTFVYCLSDTRPFSKFKFYFTYKIRLLKSDFYVTLKSLHRDNLRLDLYEIGINRKSLGKRKLKRYGTYVKKKKVIN